MNKTPASPFAAALVGGVVVAAAFLALGVGGGDTKTVIQQSPLAARRAPRPALTPHEIYERDAPGVVFVTSRSCSRRIAVRFGAAGSSRARRPARAS